jgi:GGDEF domain-containing protein
MKRGSILLAIVFTLAIPAMIAWPALRIAGSWTAGQETVRSSYGALRRLAINSINLPTDAAEARWTDAAWKAWNDDKRLLAVVVSDPSGTVLYALPDASPYYAEPGQDAKGPAYVYPENTVARFNGVIASGLVLDALYVTLRQGELYEPLKDATISLLALLALTAAWLIAASATNTGKTAGAATSPVATSSEASPEVFTRKSTETGQPGEKVQTPVETRAPTAPETSNSSIPDHLIGYPERMELSSPPATIGFPAIESQADNGAKARKQAAALDEDDEIELLTAEEPLQEKAETPGNKTSPLDGPRGLYDPETGLGWESYLRERLGAELRRSASFEQDLSILIASLDSATGRTDPNYGVFAKTSRSFFAFNDLAFIFGTTGLAIILPNSDIDQAMRMSEELLKKLALLIQDRSDPMSYLNLFMGLSSRAGRLVDADRLLGEAMAAHRKAREERDTHIMAFRPDPEKFRAYLANQ